MGGGTSLAKGMGRKKEGGAAEEIKGEKNRFWHGCPETSTVAPSDSGTVTPAFRISKKETCFLIVAPLLAEEVEHALGKKEQNDVQPQPQQPQQNTSKSVRWAFYNDSRQLTVKITVSFFCATQGLRVINEDVKTEHTDDNCLRASVMVRPLETVVFVEGLVGDYSISCEVLQ
ncbi:hypothetical protein TcG_07939 [Trypanosoma cruzi]|nr:hypothetical protein TcG_07939 [Trypanosoma cruzi]